MPKNSIDGYIKWITPTAGDPTYSLLKAHLLFEELLRAYLKRMMANPDALDGARLSFAQVLAVARACAPKSVSDHWSWTAIEELNKLRNMLAHQTTPKNLTERLNAYVKFITDNSQPLPEPSANLDASANPHDVGYFFSIVDMVTVGLYCTTSGVLGFNIDDWFIREEEQLVKVK